MEPVTLLIVGGALNLGLGHLQRRAAEKRAAKASGPRPIHEFTLPSSSPHQVEQFTHVVGERRLFDRAVSDGMPEALGARSAVPIPSGPLGPSVTVYRVLPLLQGARLAADVLREAHQGGRTVLGSLSLVLVGLGIDTPMLLVVGGPECAGYARGRGDFAILTPAVQAAAAVAAPPPAAPVSPDPPVAAPPPPEQQELPAVLSPEPAPPPVSKTANGAHRPAPPVIVTDGAEVEA